MSTLPTLCNQWDMYRLLQWLLGSLCPLSQRRPSQNPTTETQDRDPLDKDPGQRPLPLYRDPTEGTWDQAARHEATSYRDPPSHLRTVIMKSGTDMNGIPCEKLLHGHFS